MNPSAFNPYLNWLSRAHSTNAHNHHFNTCNHHYHNHSSLHTNFCFRFFWKIELKFKRSARKNCQANNQRLFDYITDYSANQMNNQDIGIKKVSQHILRAGKSAVYATSRLSVYYSNSTFIFVQFLLKRIINTFFIHFIMICTHNPFRS